MTYQVLARKWRPKRLLDLIGQEHVVRALYNALRDGRLHHAYLLTGTRGVGKTTIARVLAKSLNCERGVSAEPCGTCMACVQIDAGRFVDVLEIDAASNTGIDNIREVLENAQYLPSHGRFKVYIIDEVHMLSRNAFNAMLKTLEEPSAHVKFILATTDPQKVPVTVLSRCLQFNLRNIAPQQICAHLVTVLTEEAVLWENAALTLLARAAAGSMRDALSLLDQAIAYGVGEVREEAVRAMLGVVDRRYVVSLAEALCERDGARLMREAVALAEFGVSFDGALSEMALLWHQLALAQTVPTAVAEDEPERDSLLALSRRVPPEDVQLYYQIALHGRRDLSLAPDELSGFSMTLLRMLAFYPEESGVSSSAPASAQPVSRDTQQLDGAVPSSRGALVKSAIAGTVVVSSDSSERALKRNNAHADAIALGAVEPSEVESAAKRQAAVVTLPPAVTSPCAPESASSVLAFDGDWSALVAALSPSLGMARMLAQNAVLKSFECGRLALAVPESFRHVATRDYQEKLKGVLCERCAGVLEIVVTIEDLERETPAMKDTRARQLVRAEARIALEADPIVQQFVRDVDATLLTDTIQPIQEN